MDGGGVPLLHLIHVRDEIADLDMPALAMSSSDISLISLADTQVCINRLKHRFFVFWHFICLPPLQGRRAAA